MSASIQHDDGGIDIETTSDAEQEVKTGHGVMADDVHAYTEGEGRQTRYFLGGENVPKAEVVEHVREADDVWPVMEDDGSDDEPADGQIECEYCGDTLGYLTGSHMGSHDDGPQTVDQYREHVAGRKGVDPSEVPLCTDEMMEEFEAAGQHDEATLEELSERNKARWEAGEYDHLRGDDGSDD